MPRRRVLFFSFLALLLVHLSLLWIYWAPQPKELLGDENTYRDSAQAIAQGRPAELDLLWPPLYPRFVAWSASLTAGSVAGVQLVQTLLLIWIAIVLRTLWRRFHGPGAVGDLLALTTLTYPPLVAFAHYLWPEVLHLALWLSAAWVLALRPASPLRLGLAGLLLGLALLTKSLLGPFLLGLLLWYLGLRVALPLARGDRRRGWMNLRNATIVTAAVAVAVLPTVYGNWRDHRMLLIADSSAFNVWVGLNDVSPKSFQDEIVSGEYIDYRDSAATVSERNRILRDRSAQLLTDRGWARVLLGQLSRQYFRLLDHDSFLTDQLPGGVIFEGGGGYRHPPQSVSAAIRLISYTLYVGILVLAVAGLAVRPPGRSSYGAIALAFLVYCLALFFVVHVKSRYRIQLLPVLLFYAGSAVEWWLERSGRSVGEAVPRRVWVAAAVVALVVLLLAFGGPLVG